MMTASRGRIRTAALAGTAALAVLFGSACNDTGGGVVEDSGEVVEDGGGEDDGGDDEGGGY